jgi:hypothetical protein
MDCVRLIDSRRNTDMAAGVASYYCVVEGLMLMIL